jgi:hypothetical protein
LARIGWWALMPVLLWSQSGCLWTEETVHSTWMKRFQDKTITPEHALIEVALIELPFGHEYLNHGLWQHTDELIVNLERRSALEENGLRLGQLVGATPGDFQQLLLSKRSCANPQAMIFPAGKTMTIYLGPVLPEAAYDFVEGKQRTEIALDQARFCLDVTARFAPDGRTTLTFLPKAEHGEQTFPFHAAPERSAWELRIERAAKKHPELSWEVTLGVNQYLIVGGRPERERAFGKTAFMQYDGTNTVQRLLVIRNCRSVTAREAHEQSIEELIRRDRTPPLALQATIPASRGKTH